MSPAPPPLHSPLHARTHANTCTQQRNKDDVYFISTRENLAKRIKNLSRKSLVSKFPGMYQTCSNQTFAREMSLALKLLPAATSSNAKLWPETFVLPDDMKDVKEAMVRAQAE